MKNVLVIGGKGYIGSAVSTHLAGAGFTVQSWDTCWFGDHTAVENARADYGAIAAGDLRAWDAIVLTAGHAGVAMCADRDAAFTNNVQSFARLVEQLDRQRLIFMSSSSIYSGLREEATEDAVLNRPEQYYDQTMIDRETCAAGAGKHCYGLRLGTVCGASPNLRSDLMLNKMYLDATRDGVIHLANPDRWRPILAMTDLCRAIERIVERPQSPPGIYNVASFNSTIGQIAAEAARLLNAVVVPAAPSLAYDMRISTAKFRRSFDFTFEGTVESIVRDLAAAAPGGVADRPAGAHVTGGHRRDLA